MISLAPGRARCGGGVEAWPACATTESCLARASGIRRYVSERCKGGGGHSRAGRAWEQQQVFDLAATAWYETGGREGGVEKVSLGFDCERWRVLVRLELGRAGRQPGV